MQRSCLQLWVNLHCWTILPQLSDLDQDLKDYIHCIRLPEANDSLGSKRQQNRSSKNCSCYKLKSSSYHLPCACSSCQLPSRLPTWLPASLPAWQCFSFLPASTSPAGSAAQVPLQLGQTNWQQKRKESAQMGCPEFIPDWQDPSYHYDLDLQMLANLSEKQ